MKSALIIFACLIGLSFAPNHQLENDQHVTQKVYICTGAYSTKYHFTRKCRGLSNCKGKIQSIELSKAKALKRTLCGWED